MHLHVRAQTCSFASPGRPRVLRVDTSHDSVKVRYGVSHFPPVVDLVGSSRLPALVNKVLLEHKSHPLIHVLSVAALLYKNRVE